MPALQLLQRKSVSNELHFSLEGEAVSRVTHWARNRNAPVRALFLAAFARALGKCIGTQRPTIDVVCNGRSPQLSDPLGAVGLFWNLLPITLDIEQPADALLADTFQRLLRAEAAGVVPESVLQERSVTGELTYAAYNFVQFHNEDGFASVGNASVATEYARDRFHHAIKLTASMARDGGRVQFALEFDPGYLVPSEIETVRDEFWSALHSVAALPLRAVR